jgi:hypothetical protein
VQRLRLWTPARWAAACPPYGSRGDVVFHLAQALADTAAELEHKPRRRLPRLDSDLGLADQLAVTSDDLVRTQPDEGTARRATAHLLVHRAALLGEQVPAGLDRALGGDVVTLGRRVCDESAPEP